MLVFIDPTLRMDVPADYPYIIEQGHEASQAKIKSLSNEPLIFVSDPNATEGEGLSEKGISFAVIHRQYDKEVVAHDMAGYNLDTGSLKCEKILADDWQDVEDFMRDHADFLDIQDRIEGSNSGFTEGFDEPLHETADDDTEALDSGILYNEEDFS